MEMNLYVKKGFLNCCVWMFVKVGGWTEVYEGLTFATVRGAGHEVPLFKPRAALQLFKSFLKGDPLPRS
jgi:serine carboxypeptidase-like clade 2